MAILTAKNVQHIIIHCSATKPSMDIGRDEIDYWHRQRGWWGIGYHYVVRRDGMLEVGRPLDKPGAHVSGYNNKSVGVCMVGGVDDYGQPEDNFEELQEKQMSILVPHLMRLFPNAEVNGHYEFSSKACPCFSVKKRLKKWGIE